MNLDLDWLPYEAFQSLLGYDADCVGTKKYLGLAYFWNVHYKFALRDATPKQRKKVHDKFLDQKLRLDGQSKKHDAVIASIIPSYRTRDGHLVRKEP